LEQYPDLAEELEEVVRKMEDENKEYQAQADELKQKVSHSAAKLDSIPEGGGLIDSDAGDDDVDDLTISEEESTYYDSIDVPTSSTQSEGEDVIIDNLSMSEENTLTDLESVDASASGKEDFTLATFVVDTLRELLKQSKDDMKRILGVVVPVMKQFLGAGDKAWRTLKALFVQVREAYESANNQKSPSDQELQTEEDTSKSPS
jgi:hypothetical protein